MAPLRAVTLDVTPTILRLRRPISEVYRDALERFGIRASPEATKEAYSAAFRAARATDPLFGGPGQYKPWWKGTVRQTLGHLRGPTDGEEFEQIFQYIFAEFNSPTVWEPQPGAAEALREMSEDLGLVVGVLDNNYERYVDNTLPAFGLHRHLRFACLAAVEGCAKPSPQIFALALEKASVAAAFAQPSRGPVAARECLHIGNHLTADFAGARSSGFRALLLADPRTRSKVLAGGIDPARAPGGHVPAAKDLVDSLAAALPIVRRLCEPGAA